MPTLPAIRRFCVLGFCAALSGCASPVARRPAAFSVGDQGGAWEVVLPGGQTGPQLAMDWESSRRDEALNYRDESSLSDADRPSLESARYLFLSHRADQLLYFQPGYPYYGRGFYGHDLYLWR